MKLNEDGNLIGRLGALAALAAVVLMLGRVCGSGVCPVSKACGGCPFMQAHGQFHN